MSLGFGLLCRHETEARRPDLAEAIEVFERARVTAGSEANIVWTMCANPVAHAYRLDGRRDLGRRTALDGLRGHAWNSLLQTDGLMDQLLTGSAGGDAIDAARWCLVDGHSAGAAVALDAGRALQLYAATEWRDVATRWSDALRHGAADVPTELRRQVMEILGGNAPGGRRRAGPARPRLGPAARPAVPARGPGRVDRAAAGRPGLFDAG